jgi:hypothetical protein
MSQVGLHSQQMMIQMRPIPGRKAMHIHATSARPLVVLPTLVADLRSGDN